MNLPPDLLLRAYAMGVFPMAESRGAQDIHWVDPKRRGVFPLDSFHISRSLRHHILTCGWRISVDEDFDGVLAGCADRPETWINAGITTAYRALHAQGHVHSLEVWQGTHLVGGVYGLVIGAAFFGESMFSRATNGSKTALAYLMHRLRVGGFQLFDTQFLTPHLASLGAVEIPRAEYHRRLQAALATEAQFSPPGYPSQPAPEAVVIADQGTSQRKTHTS